MSHRIKNAVEYKRVALIDQPAAKGVVEAASFTVS
jgi:hypothetical protein